MYWKEKIEKINKAEKEGIFFEVKGFKFKVSAFLNEYGKVLREKMRDLGVVSTDHLDKEIIYETTIEVLIKDWADMIDEDGKEIPYSVEKAKEILLSKDNNGDFIFKDVFEEISVYVLDKNRYYKDALVKN